MSRVLAAALLLLLALVCLRSSVEAVNLPTADPCSTLKKTFAKISQTANTQIITGASSKQTYICSLSLVTAAANNVALVEGTGTTCGTSTAGVMGGSTAATGWNFGANGGMAMGDGIGTIGQTATAADNVCVFVSAAVQLSGAIGWVQQ
jgi:hypothetical protein